MLARTIAAAVQGIDAIRVEIEVTVDWGSGFMVIGLPDTAVKESADMAGAPAPYASAPVGEPAPAPAPAPDAMAAPTPLDNPFDQNGSGDDLPF